MNLRPLKDRVLILPEPPSETTASGLILAEHRKPEQTGTVVAVGSAPHPKRDEALAMAEALAGEMDPLAQLLRDLVNHEPQVHVGDYVVFSWTAGQEIWVEDGEERYLLMRESDILAVVEGLEPS